ncbi:MAG TPA: polysaccharide deacetylase family protein [Rectinema sp.]|jgi:peptidoglycan/xylan/chitin deacetylase (PgdA/CDA1 family)|nr:MAG: Bifunctional xylanase/deacetylase precursor [Spirochaetes bacterium ADurb.Bin001]HNP93960.1 polysaccharide deacetylase family protein [Rectinema sp.]HNT58725.1 polysaccharide deacetylase family protein [Rectinema sp.]HNV37032.1 polysaccharide deacetylase family protein [Rectinema sp.]HOH17652.1 polysaccharide deacetylase family protein [Rectinema sp.]
MKKSVEFWKHIIIAGIIFLIIFPTMGAIVLTKENARLQKEILSLSPNGDDIVTVGTNNYDAASIVRKRPLLSYQLLYPELCADFMGFNDDLVDSKMIFLTFDDGPSSSTPAILDILKSHNVKASFFVNGKSSLFAASRLRRIVQEGHAIGMHSYTHQYSLIYDSVENFIEDLNKNYLYIKNTTGICPTILRFPGGSINTYNLKIYQSLSAEVLRRGFIYCDWNVSAGDALKEATAESIIENVINGVSLCWEPAFVLMHDNGNNELVQALPKIIEKLKAEGYSFAALDNTVRPPMFVYPEE